MHNDDSVIILCCDRLDERIAIKPRSEVIPTRQAKLLRLLSEENDGDLPIACVVMDCNVALA